MRPDEFRQALSLLPAALHDRVLPLHRHVFRTGCPQCQRIGDTVALALTAAPTTSGSPRPASSSTTPSGWLPGTASPVLHSPTRNGGRGQEGCLASATDAGGDGRDAGLGYAAGVGRSVLRARGAGRSDASRVRPGGPATVSPRRAAPRGRAGRHRAGDRRAGPAGPALILRPGSPLSRSCYQLESVGPACHAAGVVTSMHGRRAGAPRPGRASPPAGGSGVGEVQPRGPSRC